MNNQGLGSGGNILVVDDTPVNLRLLSELLTKQGYRVRAARDGTTAIHSVRTNLPDVILLDIKMPEMDGYEVCITLKQDDVTRDIPVIFISALSDADDIVRAFEVGGVDYITKPFKFREVLARVENHLTLRRQRQQIEQQQARERQYFAKINEMKTQFIRAATHDMKTPLAMIVGYAGLLGEDPANIDDIGEYVDEIRAGGQKMLQLVEEMLDSLKIDSGIDIQVEPTSLLELLTKAVNTFQYIAEDKGIELSLHLPEEDAMVMVDRSRMSRVLDNLITNAIKYTRPNGHIDVGLETNAEAYEIYVKDTGIGIPEHALPNIFNAFFRVRDENAADINVEGTGLGLSVVQSIMEQHGGTVDVVSTHGEGSTFTVTLPVPE